MPFSLVFVDSLWRDELAFALAFTACLAFSVYSDYSY